MYGVGKSTGPQLMAEIGDTRRFRNRRAITAFFGYDTEPDDSGQHISKSRPITKKGSPSLRRTLFIIMKTLVTKNRLIILFIHFLIKNVLRGSIIILT